MERVRPPLRVVWRALGSIPLAVSLLVLVAVAAGFASLFPQLPDAGAARTTWLSAVESRYGGATSFLRSLGVFQIYHTPWFVALLAALSASILVCTVQRLPHVWRTIRRHDPISHPDEFYQGWTHQARWPVPNCNDGLAAANAVLRDGANRYHLAVAGNVGERAYLYAESGRWGQVGTLLSHTACVALVLALLLRPGLAWERDGIVLPPGRAVTLEGEPALTLQASEPVVQRYADGRTSDLWSDLSVLPPGMAPGSPAAAPMVAGTVHMSRPLTHDGLAFHLLGYGPAAMAMSGQGTFSLLFSGSQTQEIQLASSGVRLRATYQPAALSDPELAATLFIETLAADGTLLSSGRVADWQQIEVQGQPVTFRLTHYTAWRVSHDPTFGVAVGSAAAMLAGMLASLCVPYRRLWLRIAADEVQMVGTGHSGRDFEELAARIAAQPRES